MMRINALFFSLTVVLVCYGCGQDARSISLKPKDLTLRCPEGMVLIDAASFVSGPWHEPVAAGESTTEIGRYSGGVPEAAGVEVMVSAFCIDRHAVRGKDGRDLNLSFADAQAFCQKRGQSLCTGVQFERACRGRLNTRFPYGDRFNPKSPCSTGERGLCISKMGVYDQLGQGPEWVIAGFSSRQPVGSAADLTASSARMGGWLDGENRADNDCMTVRRPSGTSAEQKKLTARFRCCTQPSSQSRHILDYNR